MDDAGILLVLLGVLFALAGAGGAGGGGGGDGSPAEGEDIDGPIFDDTRDADNGFATGTGNGDLILGWLTEDGEAGVNSDTTTPNDTLSGLAGEDTIFGGTGDDSVLGGDDADIISGGGGADVLKGENGADTLSGGADEDTLDGGEGDDSLNGGLGSDELTGGSGNDTFVVSTGETGPDTITDFSNEEGNRDFIDLTSYFGVVEEAQRAYNEGTNRLNLTPDGEAGNFVQFDPTMTEADLTTQTTGLAANQAPSAQDDSLSLDFPMGLSDGSVIQIDLIDGAPDATGADSDPENHNLVMRSVNGIDLSAAPEDPTYGIAGASSVTTDVTGQSFFITVEDGFDGNQIAFNYAVVDEFDAVSENANVTITLNINEAPVATDDAYEAIVASNSAGGVALNLVTGTQPGVEADTDDEDISGLQIATINGAPIAPGGTVALPQVAGGLTLQPNGQTAVLNLDTAQDLENEDGQVSFTYTVRDLNGTGLESAEATVTADFTVLPVNEPQ